jgi:dihydroxy-acid dehydratase
MELMKAGLLPHPDAMTANGKSMGENCRAPKTSITRRDPHRDAR